MTPRQPPLRIGSVPEHFNLPWYRCLERDEFQKEVSWKDFPGGTGAMCRALEQETLDVAILLTEGIISAILKGLSAHIVGTYVRSPLLWGVHVHASSPYRTSKELAGKIFAISRDGSGSHLMTSVLAYQEGWLDTSPPQFLEVGTLEGARKALSEHRAQGFLWERMMTQPLITSGEWRQVGICPTPWPAFVIAARPQIIQERFDELESILSTVRNECEFQKQHRQWTIPEIGRRFGLSESDAEEWLQGTQWSCTPKVQNADMTSTLGFLVKVGIVQVPEAIDPKQWEKDSLERILPPSLHKQETLPPSTNTIKVSTPPTSSSAKNLHPEPILVRSSK